jgi:large subunit ribosomal protein L11e
MQEKTSKADNPMRRIRIEKLIINISVGESGDKLMKAQKVLKDLCN